MAYKVKYPTATKDCPIHKAIMRGLRGYVECHGQVITPAQFCSVVKRVRYEIIETAKAASFQERIDKYE